MIPQFPYRSYPGQIEDEAFPNRTEDSDIPGRIKDIETAWEMFDNVLNLRREVIRLRKLVNQSDHE